MDHRLLLPLLLLASHPEESYQMATPTSIDPPLWSPLPGEASSVMLDNLLDSGLCHPVRRKLRL